ncbi:hypothetical protein G3R49_05810 [Shewanella sp. WXL01]|uniref:tail fiber domain-containing protein n=1 Tax=Shewanella sp. WXL01 TaxID=2709721 RepID=UPI001438621B|nr:tail fiber domain-containing protein [Shewanella sp. WXL01]NKF50084.1 hypothetical protein [Shewanella sp. WXL01]
MNTFVKSSLAAALAVVANNALADQVFNDDLIVTSSACIGQDCVNGESFGFDTIRLKENNLRIKFQDTSNSASFPSNDWQLTANDSSNGGLNKFSIDDIDGGKTPFTIEAGAQSHAIYVDDGGRVGLGTSTPVVELQVVDGDSPTLRLEQDGSSGFTAQTWDIAGNETNFFVRDVTNGSKLPFKIMPSAPTNALVVSASGNIGIGDQTPDAKLDIESGDLLLGNGDINITNASSDSRVNFIDDSADTIDWTIGQFMYDNLTSSTTGSFYIGATDGTTNFRLFDSGRLKIKGTGANIFDLSATGELTVTSDMNATAFNVTSDINKKHNINPINPSILLNTLEALPISTWSFKSDKTNTVHIGPMAQDFKRLFNVGGSDKTINVADAVGISLASSKALNEKLKLEVQALRREIDELKSLIEK